MYEVGVGSNDAHNKGTKRSIARCTMLLHWRTQELFNSDLCPSGGRYDKLLANLTECLTLTMQNFGITDDQNEV